MPAITYNDWSGGLDRRLAVNVQDASRLWVLRNAYITLGKRIRKRPCLKHVATGMAPSYGLEAIGGRLKAFIEAGSPYAPPSIVDAIGLDTPSWASGQYLRAIHYADLFGGYPYVVAGYSGGAIGHHWVDTNPSTVITDTNNPRSISVTKAASRVFAINGETVRYCAAGNPRDWTASSDAGFLPVGLQQDTKTGCTAVGTFQDALVVFFPEGAQIWDVATDPTANSIRRRLAGIGISGAPLSQASFANDLAFLSPYGFRSMTVASQTDRIDDTDMGVPVDKLVVPDVEASAAVPGRIETFGIWVHELGQYWCVMDMGATSKAWVYSYSRSSKIACWSEYTFPLRITGIATLAGKVYLRTDSDLYEIAADLYTDADEPVPVEVQMAFQDAKSPGLSKQIWGMDLVLEGSADVSFKYDPRDQNKETISQHIAGDTRPGELVPVEVCSTAVAPVFRHQADEPFELSALQLYFNPLGAVR